MKIIELCPICGGKGRFINQKCPTCGGEGANLTKITSEIKNLIETNKSKLSEQEIAILELYKSGYSKKEIIKKTDLTLSKLTKLFYNIQKKLIN